MLLKFLVEREAVGLDIFTPDELADMIDMSRDVLREIVGVQWQFSFIGPDRTYSVYLAESEEDLREHSRLAGLPITKVMQIKAMADAATSFKIREGMQTSQSDGRSSGQSGS